MLKIIKTISISLFLFIFCIGGISFADDTKAKGCNIELSKRVAGKTDDENSKSGIDIKGILNDCTPESLVSIDGNDYSLETGLKPKVNEIIQNIMVFLSIAAVFSIVFGAFKLTTSLGNDEKVKKGKDIIKWTIIGFLALISSGAIIGIIINVIFAIGS